jgi:hypothetical protein
MLAVLIGMGIFVATTLHPGTTDEVREGSTASTFAH